MDLLITAADDVTADLLCEWAGRRVLRVNLERYEDYALEIAQDGFRIEDHFGRRVDHLNIGNIIWRKPLDDIPQESGERWFAFHEFRYAVRSIVNQATLARPKSVPIDPSQFARADKFRQLRAATREFAVPAWTMTSSPSQSCFTSPVVVKSLTSSRIPGSGNPEKILFTTPVDPTCLSDGWPWFLQRQVDARYDVTVVYIDGRSFAFSLERSLFEGVDWRRHIGSVNTAEAWRPFKLPLTHADRIHRYMETLGLRFGRLDFLSNTLDDSELTFLEVNPNGQWAWLDLNHDNGLFDAMTEFLFSPTTSTTEVSYGCA